MSIGEEAEEYIKQYFKEKRYINVTFAQIVAKISKK